MTDLLGLPFEEWYIPLTKSEFFEDMKPFNNAIEVINNLYRSNKYNIYFVSTIVVPEAYIGKIKSLKKYFNWFDHFKHLKTMNDKHQLKSGVIIDDSPSVLEKSYNHHKTIKFFHSYNKDVLTNEVINSWSQLKI